MRKPIEQRIRELDEQKRALQSRLEKQERARTTRRRILLGTFLLERLERQDGSGDHSNNEVIRDLLQRELPAFLSRDADRGLFDDLLGSENSAVVQGGALRLDGTDNAKAQHRGNDAENASDDTSGHSLDDTAQAESGAQPVVTGLTEERGEQP